MKRILLVLLMLGIIIMGGCRIQTSGMISICRGVYELDRSLNREIVNDKEAFEVLKQDMTYDTKKKTVWIEDKIDSDMTVEEALNGENPLLKKDKEIKLTSGEIISNAWIIGFGNNKALDQKGNLYLCEGFRYTDYSRTCLEKCNFKGFSEERCAYRDPFVNETYSQPGCNEQETRIGETSDCEGNHPTESNLFKTCCCK